MRAQVDKGRRAHQHQWAAGKTTPGPTRPTSRSLYIFGRRSMAAAPSSICQRLSCPRQISVVIGVLAGIDYLPALIASMPSVSSQVSAACRCRLFRPCLSRIARVEFRHRAHHTRHIVAASRHRMVELDQL